MDNLLPKTISTLKELIAFESVSSRSNLDIIEYLEGRFKQVGARVHIQKNSEGNKANLLATIGPEKNGGIMLSGHSDVVPVDNQDWTHNPFEMTQKDGKLYGRGTCDMKGFVAAMVTKAEDYAAKPMSQPVHFAVSYDEEVGCVGAKELAKWLQSKKVKPDIAIVGEPTMMNIIEGHKGCCEYTTKFNGMSGHGSMPDKAVNAVQYATKYVTKLMEIAERLQNKKSPKNLYNPPWTTINVGAIRGGEAHNVIPETAEVKWEFRPVKISDMKEVKTEINKYANDVLLPKMKKIHHEASIVTEVDGEVIGLEPRAKNKAREVVMEITGKNSADVVPFGTEAGIFAEIGIEVVVCGPGSIEQAHKPDEFLEVEQLKMCLEMLGGLETKIR